MTTRQPRDPLAGRKMLQATEDLLHDDDAKQLLVRDDGTIQIGDFTLTPTGIVAITGALEENWKDVGRVIGNLEGAVQWLIGDWLTYAELQYGKTFKQVAVEWDKDVDTIYNYYYVASNVHFSLRRGKLSFNHHYAVAQFEDRDEQHRWLEMAEQGDWSVAKLRQEIRKAKSPTPDDDTDAIARARQRVTKFERAITQQLDGVGQSGRQKIAKEVEQIAKKIRNGEV